MKVVEKNPHLDNTLHVYGQCSYHDELVVCGTRAGLLALREAINQALEDKDTQQRGYGYGNSLAFQNDGEGFEVDVYCLNQHQVDSLSPAYTDHEQFLVGFSGFEGM